MSEEKTYPTYRIHFQEEREARQGIPEYGKPIEVAAAWPRKEGKQGELLSWHLSPERLPRGQYTLSENTHHPERGEGKTAAPMNPSSEHVISFCEKRVDGKGQESLGTLVEVGRAVQREGLQGKRIEWSLEPRHHGEGAYFMIEREREQTRSGPDQFDKTEARSRARESGLSR